MLRVSLKYPVASSHTKSANGVFSQQRRGVKMVTIRSGDVGEAAGRGGRQRTGRQSNNGKKGEVGCSQRDLKVVGRAAATSSQDACTIQPARLVRQWCAVEDGARTRSAHLAPVERRYAQTDLQYAPGAVDASGRVRRLRMMRGWGRANGGRGEGHERPASGSERETG